MRYTYFNSILPELVVKGLRSSLELESSLGGSLIESGMSNDTCGVEETAVSSEKLLSVRNHV
jgi:hypothetical protein